ncbi:MAG: hypothetical protein U0U69_10970 [Acidimicrobiia bacterium]
MLVAGVEIDEIDTASFQYEDLDGLDLDDRVFVVSHRWALDTATETEIVAGTEHASIRVATPAALVAMKSGAVLGGRPREPRKRASDLYELYRLVLEYDRTGGIGDAGSPVERASCSNTSQGSKASTCGARRPCADG